MVKEIKRVLRRVFSPKGGIVLTLIFGASLLWHRYNLETQRDYSPLIDLIKLEDQEEPLFVFADSEGAFAEISHGVSLEYFNNHPALIRKIQKALGGGGIQWRLDYVASRLLFVPEDRGEYASLFENYCHDVIRDLLEKVQLDNPYQSVHTLRDERPDLSNNGNGVKAFLVHNLVNEYVARYVFFNQRNRKVKVELTGKVTTSEVGSYATHIFLRENGMFEFVKDNYTIWQNSAKNPYTVLMTPAEETLHIVLREYTEKAMKQELEKGSTTKLVEVKRIVNHWMAVEEAIVGGEIYVLLPPIVRKYLSDLPYSWIERDIESKSRLKRYRFLKKGIEVVKNMGYQKALSRYREQPFQFKRLFKVD